MAQDPRRARGAPVGRRLTHASLAAGLAVGLAVGLAGALGCSGARTPELARAEAERIWQGRCTNCHGPQGKGDGPGATIGNARARDLTDRAWQHSVTDEHIAKVIVDGGAAVGLDPGMAPNPDLDSRPEVLAALVAYVRDLGP